MKLRIISYDSQGDYHNCTTEAGLRLRLDLMVDGYFPDNINPRHLVGMDIDVEHTFPYISIAMGVS